MKRLLCVAMTAAVLVGCSSDSDPEADQAEQSSQGDGGEVSTTVAEPATTSTTSPAPADSTATVLFTQTEPNPIPGVRFVIEITNPNPQPRVGVRTTWKALDANGAIVGTVENRPQPPIPANGSILYIGGAGAVNLSGDPAQVQVEITDQGTLVEEAPAPVVTTEAASFKRSDFDFTEGSRTYDVTFTLVALQELNTSTADTAVILRDAAGTIVGAEFIFRSTLPTTMAPGDKALVTGTVDVHTDQPEPVTVEAHATT